MLGEFLYRRLHSFPLGGTLHSGYEAQHDLYTCLQSGTVGVRSPADLLSSSETQSPMPRKPVRSRG